MTIVDTGPLVALLNRADPYHELAVDQTKILPGPLATCEAVLTETFFLVASSEKAVSRLFDLLECGALSLEIRATVCIPEIRELMRKYRDLPMSYADACLVRVSEMAGEAPVFTIDSDFHVYRRHGQKQIVVVMPN
jgi:predicted nucleic acid-binding protein